MKEFIKKLPMQISNTFFCIIIFFSVISKLKGVEEIPVERLFQFIMLSVIGGALMELSFGECIFKNISDAKRVCIFIVPFAVITFVCAVIFQWITRLDAISTYIKFIGIFLFCGVLSVILFEIEHRIRGREYTRKLREYQQRSNKNE
ncbi:MAG: hypothetical protein IJ446_07145 [Oscillospiraceae bacterium]|nr:hypothetical protein [Oscillospiraceae bacterium]